MSEPKTATKNVAQLRQDNGDCRRCGAHMWALFRPMTKLIGDYHVIICPDCLNDWTVYINQQQTFHQYAELCAEEQQLSMLVVHDGQTRVKDMMDVRARMITVQHELFTIGETFCSDVIERPVPDPPPPPTEEELTEMREKRIKRVRAQLATLEREQKAQQEPLPDMS